LIYAVSTQTNNTVQEKVDSLCNLKAGLDNQDETSFPEEVVTQFLKISPDEEYETTIEITNNEKEDLSFKEVANRLENKETELKGKAITDETGNFVSRGRGSRGRQRETRGPEGGCYTCGGPHWKKQCAEWHKTEEGRKWLLSDENIT
jgi:hypothetical protein